VKKGEQETTSTKDFERESEVTNIHIILNCTYSSVGYTKITQHLIESFDTNFLIIPHRGKRRLVYLVFVSLLKKCHP
jgi:hypothetical protein